MIDATNSAPIWQLLSYPVCLVRLFTGGGGGGGGDDDVDVDRVSCSAVAALDVGAADAAAAAAASDLREAPLGASSSIKGSASS